MIETGDGEWTADRIKRLRDCSTGWYVPGTKPPVPSDRALYVRHLHLRGFSATNISNKVGRVSRNAVIGLLHRTGWAIHDGRRHYEVQKRQRATKPLSVSAKRNSATWVPRHVRLPSVDMSADNEDGSALRLTIGALGPGQCRYPLGSMEDRAKYFCGCRTGMGMSWCAKHFDIVFIQRPTVRRSAATWPIVDVSVATGAIGVDHGGGGGSDTATAASDQRRDVLAGAG
jgi:hypothetical protein